MTDELDPWRLTDAAPVKWWGYVIVITGAVLWLLMFSRIGPRPFIAFIGALAIVGAFHKEARIGPAFNRDPSRTHPATKPERVVLFIGGTAGVAAAVFGWIQ